MFPISMLELVEDDRYNLRPEQLAARNRAPEDSPRPPRSDKKYEKPRWGLREARVKMGLGTEPAAKPEGVVFDLQEIAGGIAKDILVDGAWVGGGFVAALLNGDKTAKDVDVFFKDAAAFDALVKRVTEPKNDSNFARLYYFDINVKENGSYSAHRIGPAIFHLLPVSKSLGLPVIQLVGINYYDDAEHVIDHFDFSVCQFAFDRHMTFYWSKEAAEDLKAKRFRVNFVEDAHRMMRRIERYKEKGYTPDPSVLQTLDRVFKETYGSKKPQQMTDFWEAYEQFDGPPQGHRGERPLEAGLQ